MSVPNSMVPETDWHRAAQDFSQQMVTQVILCAVCIERLGDTTPPPVVIVQDGTSYCLDHRPPLRMGPSR